MRRCSKGSWDSLLKGMQMDSKNVRGGRFNFSRLTSASLGVALGCVSCSGQGLDDAGAEGTISASRSALGSTEGVQTIMDLAHLRTMTRTGNYKLGANITMPSTGAAFQPIGDSANPFTGTFDGGNFTITNLRVTGGMFTGMFGYANNALLKNIHLNTVTVSGGDPNGSHVGAIVGVLDNGSQLLDSYVATATVSITAIGTGMGTADVGTAVGTVGGTHVEIHRCYATGTVSGRATNIGGFIGAVDGYGEMLLNDDQRTWVSEIFTNVTVNPTIPAASNEVMAGGLVGTMRAAIIQDINVVGSVTGRGAAGGIVGFANNDGGQSTCTFQDTLFRNNVNVVNAGKNTAGLIGRQSGDFLRCDTGFWDSGADAGVPAAGIDPACQQAKATQVLKAAHGSPNKTYDPFIHGLYITQDVFNMLGWPASLACKIGSGSDGDWGFGTCGEPIVWAANSDQQHNTLTRIPNPGVQPK